jgi:arylsulfatase A-like enzyme
VLDRRSLLLVIIASLLLVSCGPAGDESGVARPNIVVIVIDTLRSEALGSYGSPVASSPEIDDLAARGVRFERVTAQCSWTRPSIGSMITSLYPRDLGLYLRHDEVLPDEFTTLAEVLQQAGYTTIGATANPVINEYYNFAQGFDHYIDADVVFDWMPVDQNQVVRGDDGRWLPVAGEIFAATEEAIGAHGQSPYFVFVTIMDVHEFFADNIPRPPAYSELFPEIPRDRTRRYMQSVRLASHEIDRFVSSLSSLPGWEETLYVIVSDHGETLGDHPALAHPKTHGYLVYESQTWVPLILYTSTDRLPRGLAVDTPIRLLDLMPTLLDYAGLEAPDGIEGHSVLPWVLGGDAGVELPEAFVVETRFNRSRKTAAYSRQWEYVENADGHEGTNPRELHRREHTENGAEPDVSADFPEEASRLEAYLREWERRHPERPATPASDGPSPELIEQLRSLGYVD